MKNPMNFESAFMKEWKLVWGKGEIWFNTFVFEVLR